MAATVRPARRVLNNILWLGIEPALRLAIAIPLAGFVAHHLGLVGYGELNFALSYAIMFGVVANFGLTEVLLRTVARHPPELARLWWSTLALKGLLLIAYLVVLLSTALVMGYPRRIVILILLLGIYQGARSLDNTARGVFAGKQRMDAVGSLNTGKTIAEVLATVAVLLLGADALGLAGTRATLGALGLLVSVALPTVTLPSLAVIPISLPLTVLAEDRPTTSLAMTLPGTT